MEIAQTIDDALTEYYSERGVEVPNWKRDKDPQWWKDYLISLGVDPSLTHELSITSLRRC